MANREKGVTTMACSGCGGSVPAEEQRDGSLAAGLCPKCHPAKEKAERLVQREKSTYVKESDDE